MLYFIVVQKSLTLLIKKLILNIYTATAPAIIFTELAINELPNFVCLFLYRTNPTVSSATPPTIVNHLFFFLPGIRFMSLILLFIKKF